MLGTILNSMADAASPLDWLIALGGGLRRSGMAFAAAIYSAASTSSRSHALLGRWTLRGRKTAVDLSAGMNLAAHLAAESGPVECACSTPCAGGLFDGMAEVIKYGVILDATLFRSLACVTSGMRSRKLSCAAARSKSAW
jgi:3-dehydroquinate synthetase